jgi:hypothetical protein
MHFPLIAFAILSTLALVTAAPISHSPYFSLDCDAAEYYNSIYEIPPVFGGRDDNSLDPANDDSADGTIDAGHRYRDTRHAVSYQNILRRNPPKQPSQPPFQIPTITVTPPPPPQPPRRQHSSSSGIQKNYRKGKAKVTKGTAKGTIEGISNELSKFSLNPSHMSQLSQASSATTGLHFSHTDPSYLPQSSTATMGHHLPTNPSHSQASQLTQSFTDQSSLQSSQLDRPESSPPKSPPPESPQHDPDAMEE